ncbi:trypsin-like peptidase domain-containing protein [Mesorhizobium sp. ES1-4]|uniref:trypsin-like peptidase domain-containing protein n=1 Tax=Mesorhizobium sp. ES1-4 TaxID=2876627 RepID=UPI001CCEE233|nr:trypsin-like peptidase domain-containing protein [Mesorhizobium sp. ES1-4]
MILSASLVGTSYAKKSDSTVERCIRAKTPNDKVYSCSIALKGSFDRRTTERLLLRRGNALAQLGIFSEAVKDFSRLIQADPTVAGYVDNRTTALRSLGLYQEALSDANHAVELAPREAFVYHSRGLVFDGLKQFSAALSDFDQAISLDPSNTGFIIERARIKVEAGRTSEAIEDLSRVISQEPNNLTALRQRGFAHLAMGGLTSAAGDLIMYSRTVPNDPEVAAAMATINSSAANTAKSASSSAAEPSSGTGVTQKQPEQSVGVTGTGFFVSSEGYVITNAHVVRNCSTLSAAAFAVPQANAELVAKDTANDLALLKIAGKAPTYAPLRSGVRVGEDIAAFGYPLHGLLASAGNFTAGNVSALAGVGDDSRYIQISAPVQPGNSGGPVLDQYGNVVGVVVAKLNVLKVAGAIDDVPQNVNFAIKTSVLISFLQSTGVEAEAGNIEKPLSSADLADRAKSISVFLRCVN